MNLLVLADDLSGALEAGAAFAARGLGAVVTVGAAAGDGRISIVDTESRHATPEDAARLVEQAASAWSGLIYKKTDSTLRGNIAAELGALAARGRIAYVAAHPAMGRTVRSGVLYVRGVPLAESEFASDPLNPVVSSSVRAALGAVECAIFDGETAEDVRRAVAGALEDPAVAVIAGPASVASAIAESRGGAYRLFAPRIGRALIVNGSLHPVSARQVERALEHGLPPGWEVQPGDAPAGSAPLDWARRNGAEVARRAPEFDALIVFGGDTAYGILDALGCPALEALGEIAPGVAASRCANGGPLLITKPGGFGDAESLVRLTRLS